MHALGASWMALRGACCSLGCTKIAFTSHMTCKDDSLRARYFNVSDQVGHIYPAVERCRLPQEDERQTHRPVKSSSRYTHLLGSGEELIVQGFGSLRGVRTGQTYSYIFTDLDARLIASFERCVIFT